MDITLSPCALSGSVSDVIASKSMAHRAFICAALADRPTKIECNSSSNDITATVSVLRSIGAGIDIDGSIYTVTPITKIPSEQVEIDFGESGSTMRFMLPVLGALGIKAKMITHGRLTTRPLSPLYEELTVHGMKLSAQGKCPLYCEGRLAGHDFSINGSVSSQFISGLLFALAIMGGGKIIVQGKLESASYVDLTTDMLKTFGVTVIKNGSVFTVSHSKIVSPDYIRVEGDWSNAAFWLAAGALSKDGITVSPLNTQSIQGDRAITDILSSFGANVTIGDNSVTVKRNTLKATVIDAADIPDLVPVISVVAAACEGETLINNVARLRFKESDRVATVCEMLSVLGIQTRSDENTLTVCGGALGGGSVDSHNDHRIAMSAAVASCASLDEVTVLDAGAVNKSYPNFFEEIEKLGAKIRKEQ